MTGLELHVLSGTHRGRVLRVDGDRATVGRSPEATLRFDPEGDLEVSALHALLIRREGRWYVRDLESRNGTWLDGTAVEGDRRLHHGSRIRFGAGGPEVQVGLPGAHADLSPTKSTPAGPPAPGDGSAPTPSDRIRALTRRNRTLTHVVAGGLLLVLAAGATVGYAWMRRDAAFEQERRDLRARMDSLLEASHRAIEGLRGQMNGLATVLRESEDEVRRLRASLDQAEEEGADGDQIDALRMRLQAATVALTRQQLAASLDFSRIEEANRSAVAVVYVEMKPGTVSTGTAFAVRADGILLTNRHVVQGEGDASPARIGVQFSGSPQVWPARVLRVSPEADLAVLRVDNILGDVPTILGFNERTDTVAPGSPVAVLGYALGGEVGRRFEGRTVPRPLLSAGVVQGRVDDHLEILGYGEQGASGSPVLDGEGRVIAVLYGGRDDGGSRTLFAVPAPEVLRFLGPSAR